MTKHYFVFVILISALFSSCSNCSGSGSRARYEQQGTQKKYSRIDKSQEGNSIIMRKQGGVYYVPIKVNDIPMEFIFDTGASSISMSVTEVLFLVKQGKINEDDIIGSQNFIDATGTISEGTIINLRSVVIGDKILYNVKASVVHNLEAPLLLGQSALSRFGKISIDYERNLLTFSK